RPISPTAVVIASQDSSRRETRSTELMRIRRYTEPIESAAPASTKPTRSRRRPPSIRCGDRVCGRASELVTAVDLRVTTAMIVAPDKMGEGQKPLTRLRLQRFQQPSLLPPARSRWRSEEHTSELQSRENLVCRLLLEKKKTS